ncbi:hypothetical protein PRIPAC_85306 [Pristionchus pacificus]|uniref:Uncharacterized protein n=1 Tax=Pristionchus pacificus TaxID=54126 RepID=A0A454Y1D0_PRIPA|nr:hypothetical protein PRIPAC_85306 [Pristionchus pacificus]|eukprot:PDM67124.1 hypothetical protein PRIPAC_48541 [Pristionchus pacificus]
MFRSSTALLLLIVVAALIQNTNGDSAVLCHKIDNGLNETLATFNTLTHALTKLANKTERCDDVLDNLKQIASSVKDWMEEKKDNFREKMAQVSKWLKHAEDIPPN